MAFHFIVALGIAVAPFAPSVVAQLPKSTLTGDEPLQWKVDDILKNMPTHGLVESAGIAVPQWCNDKASGLDGGHTCEGGIEARALKFDDCDDAWTVCRCGNVPAAQSWDVIATQIGKLPPGARSYNAGFMFTNGGGCDAISSGEGFIRVHGDCSFTQYLLVHEIGHSFDFNSKVGGSYYDWAPWIDAITQDSCVTDNYANNNVIENFGQMFSLVTAAFFAGSVPVDPSCLQRQFDTIWNDWRFQEAMQSPRCLDKRPGLSFVASAKFAKPLVSDTVMNSFLPPPHRHAHEHEHNHTHSATRPSAGFTKSFTAGKWPLPPVPSFAKPAFVVPA